MSDPPLGSPIVLDAILSDEKIADLLALKTEYPELDFKATLDIDTTEGIVELAKDIGAMQVLGGYIIVGVGQDGEICGVLDGTATRSFDEATLVPKLLKYLPAPLELRTRVVQRPDSLTVVAIYVGRNPAGFAIFPC